MKACVIGLGRVGWEYSKVRGLGASHLGALIANPKIDCVIGVDSDPKRIDEVHEWHDKIADERSYIFMLDDSYVHAIKEFRPEIAIVCTPTPSHYEIMHDIIHAKGPQVICLEKPVGSSLEEANKVANRQAYVWGLTGTKPKVCVHFDRRWHKNWQHVKEILDAGDIGKPLLAIGHHPGPLLRSGIHMLDLFGWYFGPPTEARSLTLADSWMTKKYPETDDVAYDAEIFHASETRSFLFGADSAEVDYQLFELEILGTKGAITVYDNGTLLSARGIEERETYGGLKALDMDWVYDVEGDWVNRKIAEPMVAMVDDLVAAAENPDHQLQSSLEDGVKAQLLVSMIRQSKGKWVKPTEVDPAETVKSI